MGFFGLFWGPPRPKLMLAAAPIMGGEVGAFFLIPSPETRDRSPPVAVPPGAAQFCDPIGERLQTGRGFPPPVLTV